VLSRFSDPWLPLHFLVWYGRKPQYRQLTILPSAAAIFLSNSTVGFAGEDVLLRPGFIDDKTGIILVR
jgi:hypothetical protein